MSGITWQHIIAAERCMEALAALEITGKRELAEFCVERARTHAARMKAEDPAKAMPAIAILLQSTQNCEARDRLYFAAAVAIELELEPDEQARQVAQRTIDNIKRDTAPLYRDNKPFSIFKS